MGTALYVQHPQAVAHTRWKLAFGDLVCAHCFSVSSSNESSSVRAVIDWPVARFDLQPKHVHVRILQCSVFIYSSVPFQFGRISLASFTNT